MTVKEIQTVLIRFLYSTEVVKASYQRKKDLLTDVVFTCSWLCVLLRPHSNAAHSQKLP